MMNIDKEITGGLFGALSTLLAIIIAAFSTLWTLHTKLVDTADPADSRQLGQRQKKHRIYRRILSSLLVVIFLLLVILFPALKQVLSELSPTHPFSTVRALLVLFYALLAGTAALGAYLLLGKFGSEITRLQRKIDRADGKSVSEVPKKKKD